MSTESRQPSAQGPSDIAEGSQPVRGARKTARHVVSVEIIRKNPKSAVKRARVQSAAPLSQVEQPPWAAVDPHAGWKLSSILRPELIKIELNIVELSIPANLVADTDVHDLRVQFILRLTPDSDSRARSVEAVRILTTMSFRPRSASSVWQPSDDTKTHLVPLIICPTVLCVPDTVCTGAITLASVDTDLIVFGADSKLLLMQRISLIESQGLFPARGSAQGSEDLATVTWTVAVPDDALKPRAADGQAPPSAFKPPRKKRMAKTLERALYEADLLEKEQIAQRVERLFIYDQPYSTSVSGPDPATFQPTVHASAPPKPASDPPTSSSSTPWRPVPRFDFVAFNGRAIPYPGLVLPTYPALKTFDARSKLQEAQDTSKLRKEIDRLITHASDSDVVLSSEQQAAENAMLRNLLWNTDAFFPSSWAQTSRNFHALQCLITSLNLDYGKMEAIAARQTEECFDYFIVEEELEMGPTLRKALDVFHHRVGWSAFDRQSAFDVQAQYRMYSAEEAIPQPNIPITCTFCGAPCCKLHIDHLLADNVPTSKPSSSRRTKLTSTTQHAKNTCSPECWLLPENTNRELESQCSSETKEAVVALARELPHLTDCQLAMALQQPCWQSHAIRREAGLKQKILEPIERKSKSSKKSKSAAKQRVTGVAEIQDTHGYDPCRCVGACRPGRTDSDDGCECCGNATFCDRFCGCPSDCPRRFRGCNCRKAGQDCDNRCPCHRANRECDPHLCECTIDACVNSDIRAHRQIRTVVIASNHEQAGFGLAVLEDALAGHLLGLYAGEMQESQERYSDLMGVLSGETRTSYRFGLDALHELNTLTFGNGMRFMNNDEKLNCCSRLTYIDGTYQMAVYAITRLKRGDELMIDYGQNYPKHWLKTPGT